MYEQWLYGIKVRSRWRLCEALAAPVGPRPTEPGQIELVLLDTTAEPVALTPLQLPLFHAHERELFLHTDRPPAFSLARQPWRLEIRDVVSMSWQGGQPTVYCRLLGQGSAELARFWFVHIFLPLYLTLERVYNFIHAAAVEIDGRPVLFLAPSMGGKSTLGDYFLRRGHPMLSDDKVATFAHRGRDYAVPSHPHHRPWRENEVLGAPVGNFAARIGPIAGFYVLEDAPPDSRVEIRELAGYRKFEQLLPGALYSFRSLHGPRLRWLAGLADRCGVFMVRRPWNIARVDEVYEAICRHSRSRAEVCPEPSIDSHDAWKYRECPIT